MKNTAKKTLAMLLCLVMMLGLLPGMSLTALAWDGDPYSSLKNTTTVVKFDNKDWYLIDYDSSTVTLLSKECVAASVYNFTKYVEYASSKVKTAVDNWYSSNITDDAKSAVVDNKMFLLTKNQANAMTEDTRKCSQPSGADENSWWLCSPGSNWTLAAFVDGDYGDVYSGCLVDAWLGVRPALKLNLSSVIFSSESNTFSLKPAHTHSFTYSATGATITATCGEGCDVTEGLTLTISAPTGDLTADGTTTFPASLSTGYNTTAFPGEYPITYTKDGQPFDGTPTEAGTYTASVTVGDATASVSYTITAPTVPVTGVTLTKDGAAISESIALTVGSDTATLTATVAPENATNKTVVWTTTDANVATVADGVVTAVAAGSATITATATNGTEDTSDDVSASCTVTVSAPVTAKTIAYGESYYIGDSISFSESDLWVRYDDDGTDYVGRLVTRENTTVPTPTYDSRCSQWKFAYVWEYDMGGWSSYNLRITGPADVTPIGFKCSGGTGKQTDPFTFEAIYPAAHTHNFTYSAEGDTITATCGNDGCDLAEKKVTLTIGDPANIYYDDKTSSHEFTLVGLEAFNSATGKTISVDNIVYYKGDNQSSDIKNNNVKLTTYKAKLTVEGKTAEHSFTFTAKPVAHTHSFSYTANGAVITATCNGAGTCDLTNKQATLTLNAPLHTAYGDGKDANATFTGEIPGKDYPVINYSKGSAPLGAAPTDAGTYTAWCQLGNAKASVEYTIGKADAAYITEPAAKTLHYTGQPQALVTAGEATGGQIAYAVTVDPNREPDVQQGDTPYAYSVPEETNPGTYYVWYKLDGGKNYNGVAAQKVAVTIGDPEASINFLGGSLRRRGYVATGVVVDFETDLRFGFNFELPEGAVVDTNKSYFRWKLNGSATADAGNKIVMKNVALENGKHVSNMVITGVPKAFYQADINCFVHLVYTLNDMEFVMEANEGSGGAYTRSVEQVCDGLVNHPHWGEYAKSLLDAISK